MPVNLLKQQPAQPVNLLRDKPKEDVSALPQTTLDKLRSHPTINALIGAGYGFGEAVENVLKTVEKGREKLSKISPIPEKYRFEQKPVSEAFPLTEKILPKPAPGISGTLGRIAGGAGAYALFPAARAAKGAGILKRIGAELPRAAAFGATQMPEDPAKGAAIGAITAPVAELGLAGAGKIAAPLLSPLKATKSLVQKALKKGYAKDLYPFVEERINTIRNKLSHGSTESTSNRDVFDRVQRHYSEIYHPHAKEDPLTGEKISHDLYGNKINEDTFEYIHPEESVNAEYERAKALSRKVHYKFNRGDFDEALNTSLDKLKRELKVVGRSPTYADEIDKALSVIDDTKKLKIKDFDMADIAKLKINNLLGENPSKEVKSILNTAIEGLRKSVEKTYKGSPELYKIWRNADKRFVKEVIPFREIAKNKSPFMKMYEKGGGIVDNLVDKYVKPGQEDLMDNFLKILPDEEATEIAGFDYLKKFQDNPAGAIKKYSKLSPNQKKNLFPKHYEELNELEKLHKRMPIAFKAPKEIEAGTRGLSKLFQPKALLGFGGAGAIAHVPFSPLLIGAGLAGMGAKAGFGKFAKSETGQRLLMSELEKVGTPSLKSPLLKGLMRGGILSGVLPEGGR